MSRCLHSLIVAVGAFALTFATAAQAAHRMGNGGDDVRANFLRMGQAVVSYLRESDGGMDLVTRHQLDVNLLEQVLTIDVVKAADGLLVDNRGSVVDALGELGTIELATDRWVAHFENDRDVYYLVFHEMLRALAIDDDNYVISGALTPFPYSRRIITRLASVYPVLGQPALSSLMDTAHIVYAGNGCPNQMSGTDVDFDEERNSIDLAFRRFDIRVGGDGARTGRKNCTLIVPIAAPAGWRVVLTQMDFTTRVELPIGATASISSDAVLDDLTAQSVMNKSITAASALKGRLLIRSNSTTAKTACNGVAKLLRIRTAATLTMGQRANDDMATLVADHVGLSLRVEACQ